MIRELAAVALLGLVAAGCTKGSDTFITATQQIPGGGGSKPTVSGSGSVAAASVALPSNSTAAATINVSQGTTVVAAASTGTVGPAVQVSAPSGTSFSSPVLVTVPIDASKVTNVSEVVVLQRDDVTGAVKILRPISVDLTAGTAQVYVTSFSTFQAQTVPNNAQLQGTYNAVAYLPDVDNAAGTNSIKWDIGAVSSDSKFTFDGAGGMNVVSGSEDSAILALTRSGVASLTSSAKAPVNLNWTYVFNPTEGTLAITDHTGDPQHGVRNLDGTTIVFTFTSSGTDCHSRHIIVAVRDGTTFDNSILKDNYNVLGLGTEVETVANPQDGKYRLVTFGGSAAGGNDHFLTKQTGGTNYELIGGPSNTRSVEIKQPNSLTTSDDTAAHQLLAPAPIVVDASGRLDFGPRKGVVSANGSMVFLQDTQNNATSLGRHVFAAFERSSSYDEGDLNGRYQLVGLSTSFDQSGVFLAINKTTWKGTLTLSGNGNAQFGDRTGREGRVSIDMNGVGLTTAITEQTITRPGNSTTYRVTQTGLIFFDEPGGFYQGLASPDGSVIMFVQRSNLFTTSEIWYALRVTSQ